MNETPQNLNMNTSTTNTPSSKNRASGTNANGNAIGGVVYKAAPPKSPASQANPPITPQTDSKQQTGSKQPDTGAIIKGRKRCERLKELLGKELPETCRKKIEAALIAADIYNNEGKSDPNCLPDNWRRLSLAESGTLLKDEKGQSIGYEYAKALLTGEPYGNKLLTRTSSGFYSAIYQNKDNSNSYIQAFRGSTSMADFKTGSILNPDWSFNNFPNGLLGVPSPQYNRADEVTKLLLNNKNIIVTPIGHSLGGGEANYVAMKNNLNSITFNPKGYSIPRALIRLLDDPYTKTGTYDNNIVPGEILASLQHITGTPGSTEDLASISKTIFSIDKHSMESVMESLLKECDPIGDFSNNPA